MTDEQKKAAIASITCACKAFAWDRGVMTPEKDAGGAFHHPSCFAVAQPETTAAERVRVAVARRGIV